MNRKQVEATMSKLVIAFRCNTLNFIKEEDLRSKLYSLFDGSESAKIYIDTSGRKREFYYVHANWFGIKSTKKKETKGYCDLVILTKKSLFDLQDLEGEETGIFAKNLSCFVGIEIKRWPGQLHSPPNEGDCDDIRDLRNMLEHDRIEHGYALVFIDEDIDENNESKYAEIIEFYSIMIGKTKNLQIWLIPRTGKVRRLSRIGII